MSERPPLVVATRNAGKLREFRRLLANGPWELIGLDETAFTGEIAEPYDTYEENARTKADTVTAALGVAALADDSGIEVDALGGWPGPAAARWMGEGRSDAERLHGLIAEVDQRTPGDRRVRYVCVVALARPGEPTVVAVGETRGTLVTPSGGAGFGYDPAFHSTDLGTTFGEAGDTEKDAVSHRGRALRALLDTLAAASA